MIVYTIEIPSVSSGLRRTYFKKLEVFKGTLENERFTADRVYRYNGVKNAWVDKEFNSTSASKRIYNNHVYNSMPPLSYMRNGGIGFTTLELAQAAKLLLIEDMGRSYQKELDRLKDLFERNVPDVKAPLSTIKEEYPEYFL